MLNRRAPFTLEEKQEMEKLILSKKFTDEQLAKKFCCSRTTIKIKRTKEFKQLKQRRRKYSDAVKQAMLTMYVDEGMQIMDIARMLRIRYWAVWEYLEKSGVRNKTTKRPYQHITNRELFNYTKWLEHFLSFLSRKLRIRNMDTVRDWMHLVDSQKQLQKYLLEFNENTQDLNFMEKGNKNNV